MSPIAFRRSTIPAACVLPALLLPGPPVAAQDLRPAVPESAAASGDFDPTRHGLDPEPLIVDGLGLAMYRPARTEVSIERGERGPIVSIHDVSPTPTWTMTIQFLMPTGTASTPEAQKREHLNQLTQAGRIYQLLLDEPARYGGANGRLFFIEQSAANGEPYASGFLLLPIGDGLMLAFSILTIPDELPSLMTVFRRSFETINLRSTAELSLRQLSRIEAGRSVLASITPEQLRDLVGLRLWSRIYQPGAAPGSETELGYSLLEVVEAKRGELNPDRPESDYTRTERAEGIMVRIQGRLIGDLERNLFYDTLAMYWLTWDQTEEAWTVRGTQRQGRAARSEAETGTRTREQVLTVLHNSQRTMERQEQEWAVPDIYLSQALSPLLGRLLPREARESREFAWYYYNYSDGPQLTQRLDRWAPAEDGAGNWVLTTRFSFDAAPITTIYSPTGALVRSVRANGAVTEPITPENLRRLWERKGLPITERDELQRERERRRP